MPSSHLRMQMLRCKEMANRQRGQRAGLVQRREWVSPRCHLLACLIDWWIPNNR